MPQLNPTPWFTTMIIMWLMMLSLLKLMLHLHYQQPTSTKIPQSLPMIQPWTWQ